MSEQDRAVAVTVICKVYNHEPYLRQCLDGFIMQKTDFAFEVLVHDDASTDGSAGIITEYAEKYPEVIIPILEEENLYQQGRSAFCEQILPRIRGRYIAQCEGDDYWIDPCKLQKQFDFLESHADYSAIGAAVELIEEDGTPVRPDSVFWTKNLRREYVEIEDGDLTLEMVERGEMYGQTGTRMYRNIWPSLPGEFLQRFYDSRSRNGDMKNTVLCFCMGKVRRSSEVVERHRKSLKNDSYTAATWNANKAVSGMYLVTVLRYIASYFGKDIDFSRQARGVLHNAYNIYSHNPTDENRRILREVFSLCPYRVRRYGYLYGYIVQKFIMSIIRRMFHLKKNGNT